MDQERRWIPANEAAEILNSTPVDDGLHEDIYGPAEPGDSGEASGETDYLLRSPENARRLLEAVARDKPSQPAPSDASEAPTKHRPEGSDGQ